MFSLDASARFVIAIATTIITTTVILAVVVIILFFVVVILTPTIKRLLLLLRMVVVWVAVVVQTARRRSNRKLNQKVNLPNRLFHLHALLWPNADRAKFKHAKISRYVNNYAKFLCPKILNLKLK